MPLNQGLVLYLPLWSGDLQGTSLSSEDNYRHSCSVVGATQTNTGRDFDGINDSITVPDNAAFAFGSGDFTWGIWLKPSTYTGLRILAKGAPWVISQNSAGGNFAFRVREDASNVYFANNSFTVSVDEWAQILCTRGGSSITVYKNAVKDTLSVIQNVGAGVNSNITNSNPIVIGAEIAPSTNNWAGRIGEVWFYNRTTTSTEVTQNYNLTSPNYASGDNRFGIIGDTKWGFFAWA